MNNETSGNAVTWFKAGAGSRGMTPVKGELVKKGDKRWSVRFKSASGESFIRYVDPEFLELGHRAGAKEVLI